jgi:hypothetical protein
VAERRLRHAEPRRGAREAALPRPGSLDGFDQGQRSGAEAQTLLIGFGVDPRVWTHAMATPKDQLYLFTPDELVELKLATQLEGKAPPAG